MWFNLLLAVLYLQAGFQLGRLSWGAWRGCRSSGTLPFLFFPASSYLRCVGRGQYMPGGFIKTEDNADEKLYKASMSFFWPVKIAWNAATILAFIGPALLIRSAQEKTRRRLKRGVIRAASLQASPETVLAAELDKCLDAKERQRLLDGFREAERAVSPSNRNGRRRPRRTKRKNNKKNTKNKPAGSPAAGFFYIETVSVQKKLTNPRNLL